MSDRKALYERIKYDITHKKAQFYNWTWVYSIDLDNLADSSFYSKYTAGNEVSGYKSNFDMFFYDNIIKRYIVESSGDINEIFQWFIEKGNYCGIKKIINLETGLEFEFELFISYI